MIPKTGGGYDTVNGTGTADGTFRINNVPDGVTYILRLGPFYYVTDQHLFDFLPRTVTRCIPTPAIASVPTPVMLNVTEMTPWLATDGLELHSLALGYQGFLPFGALHDGDSGVQTTFDWSKGATTQPLVDATAGDDLYVLHRRREDLLDPILKRNNFTSRLVDWLQPAGVTLQNGSSAEIAGEFQHVPVSKSLTFSIDRAQWDAGYDGTSQPGALLVEVGASPVMPDASVQATLAGVQVTDFSRSTSLRQTITNYMYGDPFPDAWNLYTTISYLRTRAFAHPAAVSKPLRFGGQNRQVAAYTPSINTTPIVQPPGNAKIAGVDFGLGGKVALDATTPVRVTWNSVLSAKVYTLQMLRVSPTSQQSIAFMQTSATSLDIPAELFIAGQFYVFFLSAVRTPGDYANGQLAISGLPNATATEVSGLFRLSSDCGDGVVKAGEEDCDTKGETVTCDVDCTRPVCGDGLRNAAAGEACDTTIDTPACDSDCTVPVCGDGHINTALEDCDDGTGRDSTACDSDCTLPVCGDGHVNTAAGEQCDLGTGNGSGSCSSTCKVQ